MNYRNFFRGKRIAVIGLGPHGEMVADIKFLLHLGADISLYDMRSELRLEKFLPSLAELGLAKYTFGKVPPEDLSSTDLIILSPEISRKALFLKGAVKAGITIEYPNILFLKLAPAITLVGVMGACGKSTVSNMIYTILKKSFADYDNQGLFFIDPDATNGALTHLKKIKAGSVVLARIPEDMMQEYYYAHFSPHVAVITSLTSYALEKVKGAFDILEYQTYNNFIVAPDEVVDAIKEQVTFTPKAKILRTRGGNGALALQTALLFKADQEETERALQGFMGLKARQEKIPKTGSVEYYNDAFSITPHATLSALRNLSLDKNIILIFGGAYTGYNYGELIKEIPLYAKMVILLPGSGTLGFREAIEKLPHIIYMQAPDLETALQIAKEKSVKGDRILFSPGCEAIGIDLSRRERAERFVKAVRAL